MLALAAQVRRTLESLEQGAASARTAATRADVRAQLDSLVGPGFVARTGLQRLRDVQRYLRAAQHRLDRAATNPREAVLQETIDRVEEDFADLLESLPMTRRGATDVTDLGWMVEELRVSLFAQSLGTAQPVSEKRVRAAIAAVAASRH